MSDLEKVIRDLLVYPRTITKQVRLPLLKLSIINAVILKWLLHDCSRRYIGPV